MYSSYPNAYEKFSVYPPPKTSPLGDAEAATGIPISSSYTQQTQPAPPPPKLQPKVRVPWSSGLCDCFSDRRLCCVTCWCPCITFGKISEIVDKGSSACGSNGAIYTLIACVTGCPCCYSCFYRSKMRQQYTLKETPCGDCLVHCFCLYCALCQEYRELRTRGYDMSIGWHGNLEKRSREMGFVEMLPVAPVVEAGMSR